MVICLWWHEGCHLKSVKFCADAFGLQTRLIPSIFRKKSCHTHLDALDVQNWFKDYDWVSKPGLSDASFVASHAFLQFHSFKIDTIGYNWFHFFFAFSLHRTRAVEAFRLKPLKPLKPRFHFSFSFIEDGLIAGESWILDAIKFDSAWMNCRMNLAPIWGTSDFWEDKETGEQRKVKLATWTPLQPLFIRWNDRSPLLV